MKYMVTATAILFLYPCQLIKYTEDLNNVSAQP